MILQQKAIVDILEITKVTVNQVFLLQTLTQVAQTSDTSQQVIFLMQEVHLFIQMINVC